MLAMPSSSVACCQSSRMSLGSRELLWTLSLIHSAPPASSNLSMTCTTQSSKIRGDEMAEGHRAPVNYPCMRAVYGAFPCFFPYLVGLHLGRGLYCADRSCYLTRSIIDQTFLRYRRTNS